MGWADVIETMSCVMIERAQYEERLETIHINDRVDVPFVTFFEQYMNSKYGLEA